MAPIIIFRRNTDEYTKIKTQYNIIIIIIYYRHPLPQHPHQGTFSVFSRPVMLNFRRQIVLVSLSASSPPSILDKDPPRCLIIVSRRKPIRDVLRRPLSGDSDGTVTADGGPPPSRSFVGTAFDFFGDPADLNELDDDDVTAAVAVLGSATGWLALAAVFGSDDGNLYKKILINYGYALSCVFTLILFLLLTINSFYFWFWDFFFLNLNRA